MVKVEFDVNKYHKRYFEGENPRELAKELGVHYATLINRFNEYKLPILRSKSISLNHNYFNAIDNHKKAYFLGLLLSDGNVRNNTVSISLQERDKHILESFKEDLNFSGKFYFIKKKEEHHRNQICLSFTSKIIVSELKKLGVVENKANIINAIPNIEHKFLNSFILGYFDGDGTIGIDKRSNAPNFGITGNKDFLINIRKVLDDYIYRESESINQCFIKHKFTLDYKSKRAFFEIYHYLYMDCDIYLHRKKEKFEKILESLNTSNNRNKKIRQYDLNGTFIKEYNSIEEIKEKFKLISVDKIYKCIRGVNKSSMGFKWKTVNYGKQF